MRVRRASQSDARSIARIHVRAWRAAYRGILPDAMLDDLGISEREHSWRAQLGSNDGQLTLVAEDPGHRVLGFCSLSLRGHGDEGQAAEISAFYVDPDHWREGAGRAMLSAALDELSRNHRPEVTLWVLPENRAALSFYERFGFRVEPGTVKREERSGRTVVCLRASLAEPIRIVPYDPSWPDRFAREQAALVEAIGEQATGGIHHVGSTAVPGLDAKPIIDILVGVDDLEGSRACRDALASLDYHYAPYRTSEMHWFCKPHPRLRTHHLHLVPTDSARFRDELAFRDLLRASPATASEYAALKHELADRFAFDREAYTDEKSSFIRRVLESP